MFVILRRNNSKAFVDQKLKFGRLDGKGGLSPKTVNDICVVVKSALKLARRKFQYAGAEEFHAPTTRQKPMEVLHRWESRRIGAAVLRAPTLSNAAYATAATLLLRYFGVPARYVEGYFLSKDEASALKAGDIIVLDESHAHAWAEYYLNGVGFVPFEVTPGYIDDEEYELGGAQQPEYVYDGNQMKYAQVERPDEMSELKQDPFVFSMNPLWLLWLLPLALLAFLVVLILRRRKFRQAMERIEKADNREAISLRYGYARCLLRHSSARKPEGAEEAARLNELALFSAREMSGEQRQKMDGYANTVLQACKEKWTLTQKLRYKLW